MRDAYQLLFCETVITVDDQIGEGETGSDQALGVSILHGS